MQILSLLVLGWQDLSVSIAPPLAALLTDPAEKCREEAALLLTDAAARLADPASLLPALTGTLAQVPPMTGFLLYSFDRTTRPPDPTRQKCWLQLGRPRLRGITGS